MKGSLGIFQVFWYISSAISFGHSGFDSGLGSKARKRTDASARPETEASPFGPTRPPGSQPDCFGPGHLELKCGLY